MASARPKAMFSRIVPENSSRLLHDDADLLAQRVELDVADVVAVDQHLAAVDVVEARDQVGDRGLARAGRADQGDGLAGLGAEADVLEDRPARIVGAGDVLELDRARPAAAATVASARSATLTGVSRISKMRSDEAEARERHRHQPAAAADRPDELQQVGVERDQLAVGELAADDQDAADPEHQQGAAVGDEVEERAR